MTRRNHIARAKRGQRGVGLIEVLIALLVLSFGMLGLAGLQMWSLRYNQSAMERGMAVVQTYSIVDAMRADRNAALNDNFDIGLDATPTAGATFSEVSLRAWRSSLLAALGTGATGSVDCNGAVCTIRVRWDDQRGMNRESSDTSSTLQIVTTVVQL
ncbi:MAG: type IV pilus modification protein PilV [Steroidobacter sp.]